MSHQMESYTNEGYGEFDDQELDVWLTQHDLMKIKPILQKDKISLKELSQLSQETETELKEYGKNELHLDLVSRLRFAKAVKKLASNIPKPKAPAQPQRKSNQIIRIVMSQEEEDAINNISITKTQMNNNLQNTLNDLNKLNQMIKRNENLLNQVEQQIINKVRERMNALKIKSKQEITQKTKVLSAHTQKLTKHIDRLNDANTQIDNLLNNKMDKMKRKTKIKNISKNVLGAKITKPNVTAEVKVEIETKKILNYINKIGKVINFMLPEMPVMSVTNIRHNAATVALNSTQILYGTNVELAENFRLGMEDDEKKVNWKEMRLKKLNENRYDIESLKSGMGYGVRSRYKNKYGFGKYSKIVTFKTKKLGLNVSSNILGTNEKMALLALFKSGNKQIGKKWNLLYRRTRDGTQQSVFTSKCHNKNNLICLIRSNKGNVFGGYTSVGWNNNMGQYVRDDKAFIYLLKSSQNFKPAIFNVTQPEHALLNYSSGYCIFGGGTEFYIKLNGNGYAHSQSQMYERYPNNYYLTNESSDNFTVSELEIFQISN